MISSFLKDSDGSFILTAIQGQLAQRSNNTSNVFVTRFPTRAWLHNLGIFSLYCRPQLHNVYYIIRLKLYLGHTTLQTNTKKAVDLETKHLLEWWLRLNVTVLIIFLKLKWLLRTKLLNKGQNSWGNTKETIFLHLVVNTKFFLKM